MIIKLARFEGSLIWGKVFVFLLAITQFPGKLNAVQKGRNGKEERKEGRGNN